MHLAPIGGAAILGSVICIAVAHRDGQLHAPGGQDGQSGENGAFALVLTDGEQIGGLLQADSIHVPASAEVVAVSDLHLIGVERVLIEGTIRASDMNDLPLDGDAPDLLIESGGKLTIRGSILGGRGTCYADSAAEDCLGLSGGAGSDIRMCAPDIYTSGYVKAGNGGFGGASGNGGRGGWLLWTGRCISDHGLTDAEYALVGESLTFAGGDGASAHMGVGDGEWSEPGTGGDGGHCHWFEDLPSLLEVSTPGDQVPSSFGAAWDDDYPLEPDSCECSDSNAALDPVECQDGPDGSPVGSSVGGKGADGIDGQNGSESDPAGKNGTDGRPGGDATAPRGNVGIDGVDCCDVEGGPGKGGDGGNGSKGGKATGGAGGDAGDGGAGINNAPGGNGGTGGDAGDATAGRGGDAGAGGDGIPVGSAGSPGAGGTAEQGRPGSKGSGGGGSPPGNPGSDGGTSTLTTMGAGQPNVDGRTCPDE